MCVCVFVRVRVCAISNSEEDDVLLVPDCMSPIDENWGSLSFLVPTWTHLVSAWAILDGRTQASLLPVKQHAIAFPVVWKRSPCGMAGQLGI